MRIAVISDLHIGAEDFRARRLRGVPRPSRARARRDRAPGRCLRVLLPRAALEGAGRIRSLRSALPPTSPAASGRPSTRSCRGITTWWSSGRAAFRRGRSAEAPGFRVLLSHGHENESAYQSPLRIRLVELYMWLVYRLKRLRTPRAVRLQLPDGLRAQREGRRRRARGGRARPRADGATTSSSSATRTSSGTWSFAAAAPTSTPETASGAGCTPPSISTAGSATSRVSGTSGARRSEKPSHGRAEARLLVGLGPPACRRPGPAPCRPPSRWRRPRWGSRPA